MIVKGPRDIRIEEVSDPELTDDKILLETRATSVLMENVGLWSGIDARVRGNTKNPLYRGGYPIAMAGEVAGEVVAVGRSVKGVKAGDKYVAYSAYNGKHAVLPDAWTKLSPEVPFEAAISMPFAGTTLHCIRRARVVVGDSVAIIGQGPMGLLVTQWAAIAGAGQIIVTDRFSKRLTLALQLGATSALDPGKADVYDAVQNLTGGRGADVVINATNSPEAFEFGMRLARRQGRVVVLSWHTHPITINDITQDFYNKELEIIATRAGGPSSAVKSEYVRWTSDESLKYIEKMIVSGRLKPAALITHRLPAAKVAEGLRLVEEKPEEVIKLMLEW